MKIPFGKPLIDKKELSSVKKVLNSGILIHGKDTIKFEENFKKFTGAKYALSVSSCTAGMHLYFFSINLKAGDEVIVSSQSHVATAHAIELTGAKPIFIDSDPFTGNINLNLIEKKINRRTKAISVVHYLGTPVNMNALKKITKKYNLKILEDCAIALGSSFNKKHVGLLGDVGVFSFHPVKFMTSAEGGMIITNNRKIYEKLKYIRSFGVNKNFSARKLPGLYDCNYLGFNYRMSEVHAAIGNVQIKKLKKFISQRKKNYEYLVSKIKKLNTFYDYVIQNQNNKNRISYYCLNLILKDVYASKRNSIINFLKKLGIGTSIYYPHPIPRLNYYKNKYGYKAKEFKYSEKFSDQSISLPIGPHIKKIHLDYMYKCLRLAEKKYEKN
jgi:perosamine synthetase